MPMQASQDVVLVLGAGSSVEFNLPTGAGLANDIRAALGFRRPPGAVTLAYGDVNLWSFFKNRWSGNELSEMIGASERIARGLGLSRSVDDFLFNHGHDHRMILAGKMAIVSSIIRAEAQSSLMPVGDFRGHDKLRGMDHLSKTWLHKLFCFLQTSIRRDEVDSIFDKLVIINFNYDRCVELFLINALQAAYSIDLDRAAGVMSKLRISHPYGKVGALPWEAGGAAHAVNFGADPSSVDFLKLSETIRTFTEQNHKDSDVQLWRGWIRDAKNLIFLGFGFHRQNMELIGPGAQPDLKGPNIFATAYGTSEQDRLVFSSLLNRHVRTSPYHSPTFANHDVTCAGFLDQFGLSLWGAH